MSDSVEMPALGESVTEGTVTRWLKAVGDTVAVDEPLLEVSTDKVDTEIPSPVAGVLQEILVDEDETVEVGARLAVIGDGASNGQPQQDGQQESAEHESAELEEASQGQDDAAEPSAEQAEQEQPAQQEQPTKQPAEQPGATGSDDASTDASTSTSTDTGGDTSVAGGGGSGTPVTMPALGESVTEGTVTRWLKQEGETVEVDEPLLEVSTDKVDTEIPSPVAGTVQKILVAEDETVEVGAQLVLVASGSGSDTSGDSGGGSDAQAAPAPQQEQPDDEDVAAGSLEEEAQQQDRAGEQAEQQTQADAASGAAQQDAEPASAAQEAPAEPEQAKDSSDSDYSTEPQTSTPQPTAGTQPPGRSGGGGDSTYVTPLVRKLAAEHDVDLSALRGTGVGGRIRKQDVLEAAETARKAAAQAREAEQSQQAEATPPSSPAAGRPAAGGDALAGVAAKRGTTEKMTRLRKVIAQRMVESLQTSAQLTTVVEVDVTKIARLRDRAKRDFEAREGAKLSFLPFFALATVEALKSHARVNASIEDDQIVYHAQENLGVAVDTERGLLVPVIKDAGDLNIAGLSRKIADLATRTRGNKITPDELGGGTFTLTNTGSRGALFDTPIINQPQVGILGTGSVVKRPVVVVDADGGETIAIRSMVYLALSYDHRLVDGADAARFLTAVKERLEEGAFDADLGL